jgi:hypothetical protein
MQDARATFARVPPGLFFSSSKGGGGIFSFE